MKENRIDPVLASRPDVAIVITSERDQFYTWDGDGPDPAEDGYIPCDITVSALTIHNGRIVEASASLGGSYFLPGESFDDIHGYYPQMRDEAVLLLDQKLNA